MHRLKMILPGLLAGLLFSIPGYGANITVKTDRNPVALEESFQLVFEAEGKVDGDPDFAPLEKDFQILSTSVSSNMSIINSTITSTKQWQLTLLARKAGRLVVPPISFGQDKSPQPVITVSRNAGPQGNQGEQDIFVEVKIEPETGYVQSEIIYTIRLYRSVATANESLSSPELSRGKAVIEQLEDDKTYETSINGRWFRVFERNYAIYPQVSGVLSLTPVRFQAQTARDRSFILDPFGPKPKTIIRQSEPLQLDIKPIPDSFNGEYWLPAKNLQIREEWSKDPTGLIADEPATRTVVMTASGLTASQLPELATQSIPSFKEYPDKPVLNDQKTRSGIIGVRQEKNAIIPTRPGEYVLPEISLPWWNTQTDSVEYALLPERRVKVIAAAGEVDTDLPGLAKPDPVIEGAGDDESAMPDDAAGIPATDNGAASDIWRWLTLVLTITWLVTIFSIFRARKQRRHRAQAAKVDGDNTGIQQACHNNNPQQAKAALLAWGKSQWPDGAIASLGDIEKHTGDELAGQIRQLSQQLYSREQAPWDGAAFWRAFVEEKKPVKKSKDQKPGELEPLFRL